MNTAVKIFNLSSVFALILFAIAALSLCFGTTFIAPSNLLNDALNTIVFELRLPRILLGILAGGSLAVSGNVFQVILKNPLADPYILGISASAALGATIAFTLQIPIYFIPVFAFAGSLISLFLISVALNKQAGSSSHFLLLTGVLLSFLFSSLVTLFLAFAQPFEGASLLFWLMGGLSNPLPLPVILGALLMMLIVFIILYSKSYELNTLNLGDNEARALGVEVTRSQKQLFVLASLLTALSVSLTGMIGFIGLVIPHFTRFFWGNDNRLTLILNLFLGALYLILIDTVIRTVFTHEVPIGVITALLGAPMFLIILWRHAR